MAASYTAGAKIEWIRTRSARRNAVTGGKRRLLEVRWELPGGVGVQRPCERQAARADRHEAKLRSLSPEPEIQLALGPEPLPNLLKAALPSIGTTRAC